MNKTPSSVPSLLKKNHSFLCQFQTPPALSLYRLNNILNKSSNEVLYLLCVVLRSLLKAPGKLKKIKLNDRARKFFSQNPKQKKHLENSFSHIKSLKYSKQKKLRALKKLKGGLVEILSVLFPSTS